MPAGSRRSQKLAALGMAVSLVGFLLLPSIASACAKDGIPSVSVNGHLAVRNTPPGRLVPASWTYFVFKQAARHGQAVTLAENNREIARALPRAYFSHPWRWAFGDKSRPAEGSRVRHVYRKPGTYRIVVSGYYPGYHAWLPFDDVTIHVR